MRIFYSLIIAIPLLVGCTSAAELRKPQSSAVAPTLTAEPQASTVASTATGELQTPAETPTIIPAPEEDPRHLRQTRILDDIALEIPGFQIELGEYCPHEVVMNPIPPIFEEHPRAVEFPTIPTTEGAHAAVPESAADDITVRDVFRHALGDWYAYAIKDERGKYIAMRVGHPRRGPSLPSSLSLEGVLASMAEPVGVRGPTQTMTSTTGITCFPPTRIGVRKFPGILLRQEAGSQASALPVTTLIWQEGEMYWKLSGVEPGYNLEYLRLIAKDGLIQYDPASKNWIEVH